MALAARLHCPDEAQQGYQRSVNTAAGGSGDVNRSERYDAQTNRTTTSSSVSATGAGGSSVTHDSTASYGSQGDSASRDTTVDNANTGTTKTHSSGYSGDEHYADANGNTYTNDGSGWQSSSGGSSAADTASADREQQARSSGDSRFGAYQGGGWANGFGGGFGDRFGAGGGFHGGGFRR